MGKPSSFLILSVLLVAPSGSLAGPVPAPESAPEPHHQPVLLPWGQGVTIGSAGTPGGFIYCAGCSPINPQQLVLPPNAPLSKALPVVTASGVLPPSHIPTQKQLNGLGAGVEPGKGQKTWDDGSIPVQQMALHDDGRYSFSYNTADATRQEERNLDGSVSGSYSYTDPDGKLVQIDYVAGSQGYNAYGSNVPPQPVFQLPQPVRDTPEVQAAREQFLQAYAHELARHQMESDKAHNATTGAPAPEGSSESPSSIVEKDEDAEATTMTPAASNDEGDVLPLSAQNDEEAPHADGEDDAVVVQGKSEPGQDDEVSNRDEPAHGHEVVDDKTDSIVISSDEPVNNQAQISAHHNMPNPSYQITIPIGHGPNAGFSVQPSPQDGQRSGEAQPIPVNQNQQNQLNPNVQPYFYYVSVGGSPHFVSAPSFPGYTSPYPTSLKATLLNSIPLAAVHDAQVPNRGNNDNMNNMNAPNQPQSVNRPVFLEVGNSVQENQQSQPNPQSMNTQWQQLQQVMNQQWQQPQQNINQQWQQFQPTPQNTNQQWQQPQQVMNQQWQQPQQVMNQQWQQPQQDMNQQQIQMQQQWQMPQQFPSLISNTNNNNNQNQKPNQLNYNHPLLGQLVPIQFAPLGSHTGGLSFGYIPGLVLSNGGGAVAAPVPQQQNQGSQSSNMQMQVPQFPFNMPMPEQQQQQQQQHGQQEQPQQDQPQQQAPADDQPEIVLASKK